MQVGHSRRSIHEGNRSIGYRIPAHLGSPLNELYGPSFVALIGHLTQSLFWTSGTRLPHERYRVYPVSYRCLTSTGKILSLQPLYTVIWHACRVLCIHTTLCEEVHAGNGEMRHRVCRAHFGKYTIIGKMPTDNSFELEKMRDWNWQVSPEIWHEYGTFERTWDCIDQVIDIVCFTTK